MDDVGRLGYLLAGALAVPSAPSARRDHSGFPVSETHF